uniref:NADH-ubiquinone oxidoreductase chain 2 n=1 Tax=Arenivaga sp. B097 TaxID=2093454 RepID=A0A2P1H8R0_9NEOP|nr:NADH dehydrogenase subunit 2 [Arenivaga sp. B097]
MLLLFTLVMGILTSISSNSWLGVWVGLEINLLSFIPLMLNMKNLLTTESSLKYFLIQAIASLSFLFMIFMKMMIENYMSFISQYFSLIVAIPFLLKSGIAPMHWWFPSVMEGLSWSNCLILMTLQKIIPMMIISYLLDFNLISKTFILLSTIIGSIGGFNQVSIRKLLAYSSINHMGWMLSAIFMSNSIWLIYFTIYTLSISTLILILSTSKISFINQTSLNNSNILTKIMIFTALLSLGGLPPLLGFMPKWIIIQFLAQNNLFFMSITMIVVSLMTLFFYLQICYSTFLISFMSPKWNNWMNKIQLNSLNLILAFISITGLMSITLIVTIF